MSETYSDRVSDLADRGVCEGSCDSRGGHRGDVRVVKVSSSTMSWGYFSYCEAAVAEDEERGMRVVAERPSESSSPEGGE